MNVILKSQNLYEDKIKKKSAKINILKFNKKTSELILTSDEDKNII